VYVCGYVCAHMYVYVWIKLQNDRFFGIDEMELHQVFTQNNKSAYICMYV